MKASTYQSHCPLQLGYSVYKVDTSSWFGWLLLDDVFVLYLCNELQEEHTMTKYAKLNKHSMLLPMDP